jgi:hypothetical protein
MYLLLSLGLHLLGIPLRMDAQYRPSGYYRSHRSGHRMCLRDHDRQSDQRVLAKRPPGPVKAHQNSTHPGTRLD